MRILFHCWEYPPHSGGVGRYIRNMSEALAAVGHTVVVVAGKASEAPEKEQVNGVLIYRCFSREDIYSKKVAKLVIAIADKHGINVIEGADHLGSSSMILAETKRPPVVIKCHSCSILHVAHESAHAMYQWQKWFIKLARLRGMRQARHERRSIRHADILTAPSFKIIEEMGNQGLGMPNSRIVIPNPIDIRIGSKKENLLPTLLFVGRLDVGKGIQYLPDIFKRVREKVPAVQLEIIGSDSYARGIGSLREWLKQRLPMAQNDVKLFGYLTENEVEAAMERAWVIIVPSRWDTFPTVLLEAMANAKAMVVSDKGGIPEMVQETDIPVCRPSSPEFADAVIELLVDRDKRKMVGESGQRKARLSYSPARVVQLYEEMLRKYLKC